jgi:ABC-type amino acid transport substrate-binding protein
VRRETSRRLSSYVLRFTSYGLFSAALCTGAEPAPPPNQLVVAVYEAPPWCMKQPDGSWQGATVDLWKALAAEAGFSYRLQETPLGDILDGVADGRYATSAGPWAATVERQQVMDFSHSYVVSGLAIAVRQTSERDRWLSFLEALTTPTALKLYFSIAALTLLTAAVMWLLERRRNPAFPERPGPGIGAGYWWAGVTMSGVGYGDKVPIGVPGRVLALLWMFVSLVLGTALIAFVTARLAIAELGEVHSVTGLRRVMVGTVQGSSSADFLRRQEIRHRLYPSVPEALDALRHRDVAAVVYGEVILRYYVQRDPARSLELVPGIVEPQSYAFPLRDGSPLRAPINQALRHVLASSTWRDLSDRYLGTGTDGAR